MFHRNPGESGAGRFDTFTDRARKVMSLAGEESRRFHHNYIGTEHLLLGLVRKGDGVAARVLGNLGVELNKVRSAVEFTIGRGDHTVLGEIGLTPRSKKVIELAVDEARRFNHHYIGTEHLLLGLVREGEGIAAGVLASLGVNLERVRVETIRTLAQGASDTNGFSDWAETMTTASAAPTGADVTCLLDDRTLDALDALVEAGAYPDRSAAATWLIAAGLAASASQMDRVRATVNEIRRLRAEARALTQPEPPQGSDAPPADDAPADDAPPHEG